MGMEDKEQNLFKLLFFPLAARCFVDLLLKKGYLPRLEKHGDIVGYMLAAYVIGYNF